jgi:oxygen-independent coproporphyrinogen-3 oxidase
LTVGEATPFGRHRRCIPFPSDNTIHQCLTVQHKQTEAAGMKQYEVSNFAKPGSECTHNIRYWRHEPYIGLGCAAHSYLHPKRFWNSPDLNDYFNGVRSGRADKNNEEILDTNALVREMLFLGLRQRCGLNELRFRELTGMEFGQWVDTSTLEKLLGIPWLIHEYPFYRPTHESIYFADMMARDLIPL